MLKSQWVIPFQPIGQAGLGHGAVRLNQNLSKYPHHEHVGYPNVFPFAFGSHSIRLGRSGALVRQWSFDQVERRLETFGKEISDQAGA